MTVPTRDATHQAVLDHLRRLLPVEVGDGEAPPDAMPYAVVHAIPGAPPTGPWGDPNADAALVWQVDAVGEVRAQAGMLADKARRAMLEHALIPPSGWKVQAILAQDLGAPAPTGPPGPGRLWVAVERYEVYLTPA